MPYTTFVWAEAQAASGLVAMAAKGPPTHTIATDYITVKSGIGKPILFGLGMTSDTKPQASGILPSISNRAVTIGGPGALNFVKEGWMDLRKFGGIKLSEGETLSGLGSNTNVNEGTVVAGHIAYGSYPAIRTTFGPYKKLYSEIGSITSAADVTYNSGPVSLNSATTSSTWLDTEASYDLIGACGHIGVAAAGGILTVSGLGTPAWEGQFPGLPVNTLSGVTFTTGMADSLFPEPIPFTGKSVPTVGLTSTTAGAYVLTFLIGQK